MPSTTGQDASIGRALLWVLAGVLLAAGAFLAISPEIVAAAPGVTAQLMGPALLAAVPGAILLGLAAIHRRRLGLDEPDEPGGSPPPHGSGR